MIEHNLRTQARVIASGGTVYLHDAPVAQPKPPATLP